MPRKFENLAHFQIPSQMDWLSSQTAKPAETMGKIVNEKSDIQRSFCWTFAFKDV
jgi:hypothetical protein